MSDVRPLDATLVDAALNELACAQGEHAWKFIGCAPCCCDDLGGCSMPVHVCENCGDCDYGENEESSIVRTRCREEHP